jgi:hypothetical protein
MVYLAHMMDEDEISQERYESPEPNSISLNGIRYEAMQCGKVRGLAQNGGYIAAIEESSNNELWLLKVYDVSYDPEMEDDVQEIFISELKLGEGDLLHVINERGGHYLVNLNTRAVTQSES